MTKFDVRQSPVIVKAIIQDGRLYQMEYKEHNNSLIYVILKLHSMGASDQQLHKIYKHIVKQMDPLLMPKESKIQTPLHVSDWKDYLGDSEMYSSYLDFFDREITIHGVEQTIKQFFYKSPMAQSIGSQRLPTVHLALGVQHGLSEVVAQALSYMATTYQDASFLLDQPAWLCDQGYLTAHEILIEQVKVDPRFDSFPATPIIGGAPGGHHQLDNTITYRKILKNTKELLRTYVYLWRVPETAKEALSELRILAAHMMIKPIKHTKNNSRKYNINLDTGSNLLNTLNAIEKLYPNNTCPIALIRVQFLNLICSYIVQGRPDILPYHHHHHHLSQGPHKPHKKHSVENTTSIISKILEKMDGKEMNIKKISALTAVQEAMYSEEHRVFYKIMKNIYLQ